MPCGWRAPGWSAGRTDHAATPTRQRKTAGEMVGIQLLDHIIFNRSGYFSYLKSGRL